MAGKVFEPETLEGLQYLNRLYRERMLPQELFTLTEGALLSQLREGKVFLVSTRDLYSILQCLPEDDLVWQNYEPVSVPIPEKYFNSEGITTSSMLPRCFSWTALMSLFKPGC